MLIRKFSAAALIAAAFVTQGAAGTFTPKAYIMAVLDASPAMRKAEHSLEQAKNTYLSAFLDAALPSFNAGMNTPLYSDIETRWRLNKDRVNTSLSAALNLYDSASSPLKKIKTARQEYRSAELSFLIVKQDEAIGALGRFYALFSSQKRVGTAKMDLASREKQYADTNEQYQSGTRSKIDLTQSEGDKLQSELALARAESAASKALMSFNELIDADPETPQELSVSTRSVELKLPLPKEDIAKALENNFRLRQQKINLEKSRLDSHTGIMANYPRFKLDLSWNRAELGLPGAFGGKADPEYGVRASLNFPFGFLGAQNYLNIKNRKMGLRSAELDLQASVRSLKTRVLSAQKDIELQIKSQRLLEFRVKAQKDAMQNLQEEYAQGGANFLQLDNAQSKLLESSNSQINAVNDLDIALANYRILLGENIWE